METGRMDQRITLSTVASVNVQGSVRQAATPVGDPVWGYVLSQRGQESLEAARQNAKETIRVCIRYRTDVKTGWIIGWQGQNYDAKYVDRSKRRDGELWITAEATGAM